jgi:hypothetical protein
MIHHSNEFDEYMALQIDKFRSEIRKFAVDNGGDVFRGDAIEHFRSVAKYLKDIDITLVVTPTYPHRTYVFTKTEDEIREFIGGLGDKKYYLSDKEIVKRLIKALTPFSYAEYDNYNLSPNRIQINLFNELNISTIQDIKLLSECKDVIIDRSGNKTFYERCHIAPPNSPAYRMSWHTARCLYKIDKAIHLLHKYGLTDAHIQKAVNYHKMVDTVEK